MTVISDLNLALQGLFSQVDRLDEVLKPFKSYAEEYIGKPYEQIGVSERIRFAKFLINILEHDRP